MKIEFVIAYLSTGSVFVPLGLGIYQIKSLNTYSRSILLLLLCAMLADAISYFLSRRSISTNWIGNTYLLFQFNLFWIIYFNQLKKPRFLLLIALTFLIYFFVDITFFHSFFDFNTHANSIASLILVGIAVYYLYQLLNNLPAENITKMPMFWVSFAVLCYYGGTLVLFLMNNLMLGKYLASHRMLWILHNICNILKNILLAIALWQSYRNLKPSL